MSSIDERVVSMRFNGAQFLAGIKGAQVALGVFKKSLNLDESKKSLESLDAAGKKFSLEGLSKGVEAIGAKFSAMSIIGITALTNIANKAVNAGMSIAKSLTIEPVMDGFREYELKMGSIQTILANTSRHGTSLKEVTANLDELNLYADKTIYNFGDMTRNIGLFTNAGIKIEDATAMIKGFSNEAAASGTTAQGASGAAYQLSQALSAGTIRLMDWKSLTNVGMGNKNMQNGLIELAEAMGTFEGTTMTAEEAAKDFNGSLEKEWLSADVMQNYLKIQAGELSDEQMKTIGLTGEQMAAFKKQQVIAEDSATKVRTWTQLLGTLQEGVGSGWAQTFDVLIGDFDQATELWTAANDALGPLISASGDARNKMLTEWAELGGRSKAIEAIGSSFKVLMGLLTPVIAAFKEIFPPMTGKRLMEITTAIADFMAKLVPAQTTVNNLKRTFMGVFAVLDIGRMVIVEVVKMLFNLIGKATEGSGGFVLFTARIGDWLVALRDAIKNGEGLSKFFSGLGKILSIPIAAIKILAGAIGSLFAKFEGGDTSAISKGFENFGARMDPLKRLGTQLVKIWEGFLDLVQKVVEFFAPLGGIISNTVQTIGDAIGNALTTADFNGILDILNIGLLGGIALMIKKLIKMLKGGDLDVSGGFLDSIKDAFGGLTDTMSAMQAQLKAGTLLKIAGAIGILTASVVALSMIDSARLTSALVAMTVMFTQLFVSMAVFEKATMGMGFTKMPLVAASMILLGTALLILSAAVKVLSSLSWNELAKGLTGVIVLLGGLAGAAKLMQGQGPGMISAGLGLIALSLGIKILASAVTDLSGLSWEEMARGLSGVSALLLVLVGFTKIVGNPAGIISTSIAMGILGVSLKILASAVGDFAGMSWEELARGLAGMATALTAIGLAMRLMPKGMVASAVGLTIVAAALHILTDALIKMTALSWEEIGRVAVVLAGSLLIIAGAMKLMTTALPGAAALIIVAKALEIMAMAFIVMSTMSWDDIGRTAVILAGSLLVIAGGMYLMTGALPGAAALLVVAAALSILAPVLTTLGGMSWDEIVRGLVALAGVFAVIGVAGLLLTPLVPTLLGLGIAIGLIGAGTALAGAGVLALAVGITALSVAGAAGTATLVAMVSGIIGLIPMALAALGEGIIALAEVIGEGAPAIIAAVVALVTALLTAIVTIAPQIGEAFVALVTMLLTALQEIIPQIVETAVLLITELLTALQSTIPLVIQTLTVIVQSLLTAILNTIQMMIPEIIGVFTSMVSGFLTSITTLTPQIIQVFVVLITSLLQAVQTLGPQIVQTFVTIIMSCLNAVNTVAPQIVQTFVNLVKLLVETLVSGIPYLVDSGMRLILGVLNGIARNIGQIATAGLNILTNLINGITRGIPQLVQSGINLVVTFIESLATGIRNHQGRMNAAGGDLASAIIEGMTSGIRNGIGSVINAARDMAANALNAAKDFLNINSPSKKFIVIGKSTGEGFVKGIDAYGNKVGQASERMGRTALHTLRDSMSQLGSAVVNEVDINPVIRPVLDLSAVRTEASNIGGMLKAPSLDIAGSYNAASAIEANNRLLAQAEVERVANGAEEARNVSFTQNNYSPKALPATEIYRKTKNQLSKVKEELGV